jgi:uncharacterized membrane protein YfcA
MGVTSGAPGIGGVGLTPMLLILGVHAQDARRAALAAYTASSAVGAVLYWRAGVLRKIRWTAIALCLGVVPGSVAACFVMQISDASALAVGCSVVAVVSGGKTVVRHILDRKKADPASGTTAANTSDCEMVQKRGDSTPPEEPGEEGGDSQQPYLFSRMRAAVLFAIGLATGFFSGMTATGGPFVLTPLLFAWTGEITAVQVVALGLTLSVVIGLSSVIANVLRTEVDLGLALVIALAMSAGMPVGVRVGTTMNQQTLRLLIALLMVGIGLGSLLTTAL